MSAAVELKTLTIFELAGVRVVSCADNSVVLGVCSHSMPVQHLGSRHRAEPYLDWSGVVNNRQISEK